MNNLKNKVAVITGGNSGIGYAIAKALIEKGS
jgi:NAD(P)-dependent dehydrogenase (short-subunit alcohol dehydrogenase family)